MTVQNYYMVNDSTNIVDNITIWDGNPQTWTPPSNYLMLPQTTTPTKIWELNTDKTDYVLTVSVNNGGIGFTWDGSYIVTNDPKPPILSQPTVDGIQSI